MAYFNFFLIEKYQVAQLWSVAKSSKENTGGGEGIEVLKNEPFTNKKDLFKDYVDGQYTHKIYKLQRFEYFFRFKLCLAKLRCSLNVLIAKYHGGFVS